MNADLVIVGGGIIGLLSAYELAQSDIKVTLIDKGEFGKESSWAAGGILSPLLPWDYDENVSLLTKNNLSYYQKLADVLLMETGIDIELWQCGLTINDPVNISCARRWCSDNDLPFREDDTKDPTQLTLPNVAQLRTPRLIDALVSYLNNIGVTLLTKTEITRCEITHQRVTALETTSERILTEQVIICAGAWSSELFAQPLSIHIPTITPVLGQMITFQASDTFLHTILYHDGHYLIPRKDGLILAGSTLEYVGFSKTLTDDARVSLLNKSVQLMPSLCDADITHHWAGLRPGSANNHPVIGPYPGIGGLYFNCGHFRYGVAMAPNSAKTIKKCILGDQLSSDERQFLPLADGHI